MAVNAYEIEKAIITLLDVTAVRNHLGNPARIKVAPKPDIAFPWCRMQMLPAVRSQHATIGPARLQFKIHTVRFTVYTVVDSRSKETAADAVDAIMVLMNEAQGMSIDGGTCVESEYSGHHVWYDPLGESPGGAAGYCQYGLLVHDS